MIPKSKNGYTMSCRNPKKVNNTCPATKPGLGCEMDVGGDFRQYRDPKHTIKEIFPLERPLWKPPSSAFGESPTPPASMKMQTQCGGGGT